MEIELYSQTNDHNVDDYQECIIKKYKVYEPYIQNYYSNTQRKILWLENIKEIPTMDYDHARKITTFKIYVSKKITIDDLNNSKYLSGDDNLYIKKYTYGTLQSTQNTVPRVQTNQDEQFIVFEKKLLAHAVYDHYNSNKMLIIPKIIELPSFIFQPSLELAKERLVFYFHYYNDLKTNRVRNKHIHFYMNLKYGN